MIKVKKRGEKGVVKKRKAVERNVVEVITMQTADSRANGGNLLRGTQVVLSLGCDGWRLEHYWFDQRKWQNTAQQADEPILTTATSTIFFFPLHIRQLSVCQVKRVGSDSSSQW